MRRTGRLTRWRHGRWQRGATMVEYALGMALLVVVSIPAIEQLDQGSRSEIDNQAECVRTRPPPPSCQLPSATTTTAGGGGGPTSTTGVPPPPVSGTWAVSGPVVTASNWAATGEVELLDDASAPVEGATVFVEARVTLPPSGQRFYLTCVTNAAGRCSVTFDVPNLTGTQARLDAYDVLLTGEQTIDSLPGCIQMNAPPSTGSTPCP